MDWVCSLNGEDIKCTQNSGRETSGKVVIWNTGREMEGQISANIAKIYCKDNRQMKLAMNFVQWPPFVLTEVNLQILWPERQLEIK
jgi:hypothetical protein